MWTNWFVLVGLFLWTGVASAEQVPAQCELTSHSEIAANHVEVVYDCQPVEDIADLSLPPQGPPKKGKTFRWEKLPNGGWRLVEVKGGGKPPTTPLPVTTVPPVTPPSYTPPRTTWKAELGGGVSTGGISPEVAMALEKVFPSRTSELGFRTEYERTQLSRDERGEYRGKASLDRFKGHIWWRKVQGKNHVGIGLRQEVDERFRIQSHTQLDILDFRIGDVVYVDFGVGVGFTKLRGRKLEAHVNLWIGVGCDIPITSWMRFVGQARYSGPTARYGGYRVDLKPEVVLDLGKDLECRIGYSNRYFSVNKENPDPDPFAPPLKDYAERDSRFMITFVYRF